MAKKEKDIIDTTMEELFEDDSTETTKEDTQNNSDSTENTEEKKSVLKEIGFCLRHPIQGAKKHPVAAGVISAAVIGGTVLIVRTIVGNKVDVVTLDNNVDVEDMIPLDDVEIPEIDDVQ